MPANPRSALVLFLSAAAAVCFAQQAGMIRTVPPPPPQPIGSPASTPVTNAAKPADDKEKKDAATSKADTPVLTPPQKAEIKITEKGLMRIDANNSSLSQILRDSAALTGTQIDGITKDMRDLRIYGVYGPASATVVLTKLMQGTGYNVMMLGALSNGAPKSITLTSRDSSKKETVQKPVANNDDDDIAGVDNTPPDAEMNTPSQRPQRPGQGGPQNQGNGQGQGNPPSGMPPQGMPPVDMPQQNL